MEALHNIPQPSPEMWVGGGAAGRNHARTFAAAREFAASDHDAAAKKGV